MSSRNKRGGRRKSPVSKNSRSGKMQGESLAFIKACIISLILHAIIVLWGLVINGGVGGEAGDGSGTHSASDPFEIVDVIDYESTTVAVPDELEYRKTCEPFFGGIGITHEGFDGVITTVHRGYPAERLGLSVGDKIINTEQLRGEIGTPVTIQIIRDGQHLTFYAIRDRICLKDIKDP